MQVRSIAKKDGELWVDLSDGLHSVVKRVRMADTAELSAYAALKAVKEAERDLAYEEHGDNWRAHVTWGSFWSPECEAKFKPIVGQIMGAME